jgi:hypothetical protein
VNIHIQGILKHPATVPAATGVLAFASGVGLGLYLGAKRTQKKAKEQAAVYTEVVEAEEEVAPDLGMDDAFAEAKRKIIEAGQAAKADRMPPKVVIDADQLEKRVETGSKLVEDILATSESTSDAVETNGLEARNVFAADDDDWDYEEEKKHRSEKAPYIIHRDEFFAEELDYTQSTLTYYAGDDILADEKGEVVYNYGQIVGELKFGHGSGDPNVLYVRNHERNGEYEIVADPGHYAVEVLGLQYEEEIAAKDIKHSNSPRRFRPE